MKTTQPPAPPSVELRKFKHAPFASEETQCFDADVWINGSPAFHARNDGRGGCDHYTPIAYNDTARKAMDEGMRLLEAYCATLPAVEAHGQSLKMDVELFIGNLVEEELLKKDAAKLRSKLRDRYLCVEGGKLTSTKKLPARFLTAEAMAQYAARHPTVNLVNLMSREEQDTVFAAAVRGKPLGRD